MSRTSSNWHQRATWGMAIGLVVALSLLLTLRPGVLGGLSSSLEYDTLDFWFALRDTRQSSGVAIVAIDEATLRRWGGNSFRAPDVARAIGLMSAAGARSIALDVPQLCDPNLHFRGEKTLIAAIQASGRVVLPLDLRPRSAEEIARNQPSPALSPAARVQLAQSEVNARRFAPLFLPDSAQLPAGVEVLPAAHWRLAAPSPDLLAVAAGAGHLNFALDRFGRARRLPLYIGFQGRFFPAFSTATARVAQTAGAPKSGAKNGAQNRGARMRLAPATVAVVWEDGGIDVAPLLNYPYGARAESGGDESQSLAAGTEFPAFPSISLAAALENPRLFGAVRGRAVVLGLTAPGVAPRTPTPLGNRISGAELQAVALDNVVSNRPLRRAPAVWHWLFTILPGIIVGGFATSRRPAWSGPVALLCILTVALASIGVFWRDIWLDVSVPWLTIALTFLVGVVGRSRRQERENTHIASTVGALTQVSEIIAAQTRQWDLLDRVCHFATTVLGASGASALILNEKKQVLTFSAALGPGSEQLLGQTLKMGEGIAGHVAQSGEVAIVHEARGDARFAARLDAQLGFSTHNILCVPLRVRDRVIGVIEVVNRENGAAFTPADAEMLQAVANQAAIALDNARLYERLAQRVERSQSALAQANQQLLADKNLLQTVLHALTNGIVVTDAAGCVQLLNPASGALMPELARDVVGHNLSLILQDFPFANLLKNAGEARSEPVLLYRGDPDALRFIEARAAPLQSSDGELAGLVAVFADITHHKNLEQAKSDFVSFVAHEMRSPLTSISGFSAMLQKSENAVSSGGAAIPAASRTRFLGLIHEESERLTRLINNLLDVAKLEAGRVIELNRDACDFGRLADTALESQRAYSSRHTLKSDFAPDLPPIFADADKVIQILINLLSNALKYSPGGIVTLGAQPKDGFLEVSIADQGPGIAPEQRAILFSRFGRAPGEAQGAGSRAKPTGTGLGLFLTKHLVEAHGGLIWVESQAGRGATFRFTLPLASAENDDLKTPL